MDSSLPGYRITPLVIPSAARNLNKISHYVRNDTKYQISLGKACPESFEGLLERTFGHSLFRRIDIKNIYNYLLYIIFLSLIFLMNPLFAMSPEEILQKVDDNEIFKSIKYTGTMIIQKGNRRKPIEKIFKAIAQGKNKFFIEFTNPGDRGTKYLKLNDELWVKGTYAERADKISGHKLRDSMMGSDYSYEDAMENEKLIDKYNVTLIGMEKIDNFGECYKLELIAKVKEITYYKQMLWVDKDRFVALKIQLFALSGKLLKEMSVLETKVINNKVFPTEIKMENKQRENSYTLFKMDHIQLDIPLNNSFFSKQQLER